MKNRILLCCMIFALAMQVALLAQLRKPTVRPAAPVADVLEPRVALALRIAEAYWGEHADVRHVRFLFEMKLTQWEQVEGRWVPDAHTINLNIQNWDDDHLQAVMTHEYGHALGLGHSSDPYSIMWPYSQSSLADTLPQKPIDWSTIAGTFTTSGGSGIGYAVCWPQANSIKIVNNSGPALVSIDIPKHEGCVASQDYSGILKSETAWTFRIGDRDYILTGSELVDAVKSASDRNP